MSPTSTYPVKGSPDSAGYDLFASEKVEIPVSGRELVNTGLSLEQCPSDTYLRVAPRSSLALKGIDISAGVIDADYRGSLKVVIVNHGTNVFSILPGDRIAQLIPEKLSSAPMECVNMEGECLNLVDSIVAKRGSGGFGSTSVESITNSATATSLEYLVEHAWLC